jgi:hypothetical protein
MSATFAIFRLSHDCSEYANPAHKHAGRQLPLRQKRKIKRWQHLGNAATVAVAGSARLPNVSATGLPRGAQRSTAGRQSGRGPGWEYSTEVPQQVRIRRNADTRSGTVTCGDGRGWTCCLLFASRGSGVRVPLAPLVRGQIRTAGPESTAAKYRNRDRKRWRTHVRVGLRPRERQRAEALRVQVLGCAPGC